MGVREWWLPSRGAPCCATVLMKRESWMIWADDQIDRVIGLYVGCVLTGYLSSKSDIIKSEREKLDRPCSDVDGAKIVESGPKFSQVSQSTRTGYFMMSHTGR